MVAQIAPEAELLPLHIDVETLSFKNRAEAYGKAETMGAHIVTTSVGFDYFRGGRSATRQQILADAADIAKNSDYRKYAAASTAADSLDAKMLFIFSAGNGGDNCATHLNSRHLDVCTLRGASLVKMRETDASAGDRLIYVGALNDNANLGEGDNSSLDYTADYSYQAAS